MLVRETQRADDQLLGLPGLIVMTGVKTEQGRKGFVVERLKPSCEFGQCHNLFLCRFAAGEVALRSGRLPEIADKGVIAFS